MTRHSPGQEADVRISGSGSNTITFVSLVILLTIIVIITIYFVIIAQSRVLFIAFIPNNKYVNIIL